MRRSFFLAFYTYKRASLCLEALAALQDVLGALRFCHTAVVSGFVYVARASRYRYWMGGPLEGSVLTKITSRMA